MVAPRASGSPSRLTFLTLSHDLRPSGWTSFRHFHANFWELLLVTEGTVGAVTGKSESKGVSGSIYIRPPRAQHQETIISAEPVKIWVLRWSDPAPPRRPKPILAFDPAGQIHGGLKWLAHLHGLVGPRHPMLDDVTRTLIYTSARATAPIQPSLFAGLIEYINLHLGEPLTLDRLARIANMSPSHLSHEFADHFGTAPMKYVRRLRLEHACRALAKTNKVMREIAHETGFRDEFEFSRVFRRVMGVAPSSLRRQMLTERFIPAPPQKPRPSASKKKKA